MRSAVVFLALLLCQQWAQGESGGETGNDITEGGNGKVQFETTPDIWTELKELRDMTVLQRSRIEKLEQENTATQARLAASEGKTADLEGRMTSNENVTMELQGESTVLATGLDATNTNVEQLRTDTTGLDARMKTSETAVAELKKESMDLLTRVTANENKNTVLENRICSSDKEVEVLKKENAELETRMSSSENEIDELNKENAALPKVAFSVGLTDMGNIGPFFTDAVIKFSKIFTNIGEAFNPTTGVFTAPTRGAYYFRFNGWSANYATFMSISLHHNGKIITRGFDGNDNVGFVSLSNAFVLQLEKGDVVYMVQNAGYPLYDDVLNRTTFSGYQLFAL